MDPNQEPAPSFAPAPASPEGVVGVEGGMPQEQMKANLQDMLSKIDNKYKEFDDSKFSSDNIAAKKKSEALSELFSILQSKGIDPNDPEELKAYLDDIQSRDPELYKQIVGGIEAILGPQEGTEALPSDNMNINQNEVPQENV
jgi:hypothetical protein